MNRNTGNNNNARIIEKFCRVSYIHPTKPSQNIQIVDNLRIRQNYGPINSTHFAGRIYHNTEAKIRAFPTHAQLRNQKDEHPKYDDRAKVGFEMTDYLVKKWRNDADAHTGWKGYEIVPERETLRYDQAVKSLKNLRFSYDSNVSIYEDIKSFFTRFSENGLEIDTESLECFSDLKDVFVNKEGTDNEQMFEQPDQFISDLRYKIFHSNPVEQSSSKSSDSVNAATLPLSSDSSESDEPENSTSIVESSTRSEAPALDNARELSEDTQAKLFDKVIDLDDQVSWLKEQIFVEESKVTELTAVISAVLEVTKTSLKSNNSKPADITVLDRIFNFKSGIRSQVYKIKHNQSSEICKCYQCELQTVCTLTQKILKLGLENCQEEPRKFVFGRNVNGHVCETTESNPKTIELTEITSKNPIGTKDEKIVEEQLSVSVNINSHDSQDSAHRSVKLDNKQSTPIKTDEQIPKILIHAEIDDDAEITRPYNSDSNASSQMAWSDIVSNHELSQCSDLDL